MTACSMAAAVLAGCGNSEKPESSDDKTLKVWVAPLDDNTEKNWSELLTDWEEENECKVELTVVPWNKYEETYMTALNAGEGPDVGYMYNEMFPTYIDAGVVEDMSEYVTEEDKKEYKYLENGQIMGGQYGWPLVTGIPFILYYNQDILDELGEEPPQTWEDFERIAKAATKDTDGDGKIDQYGYACGFNTSDRGAVQVLNAYYYSALWQNGGQIYQDDLKSVAFANEAGKEAMNWIKNMTAYMNPDFMSYSWPDAFSNIFAKGKAAFGVNSSSQMDDTLFKETYPDLNWNFVTSLQNVNFGTFGATDSLTLMKDAQDKELAMKFIKYVTSAKFMNEYHKRYPSAALTVSEPYTGDEKMEKIYNEDKEKWHGPQAGPLGTDILTQLSADFQGIMSGELTVEEGLKEAETYSNNLLDEYWEDKK